MARFNRRYTVLSLIANTNQYYGRIVMDNIAELYNRQMVESGADLLIFCGETNAI